PGPGRRGRRAPPGEVPAAQRAVVRGGVEGLGPHGHARDGVRVARGQPAQAGPAGQAPHLEHLVRVGRQHQVPLQPDRVHRGHRGALAEALDQRVLVLGGQDAEDAHGGVGRAGHEQLRAPGHAARQAGHGAAEGPQQPQPPPAAQRPHAHAVVRAAAEQQPPAPGPQAEHGHGVPAQHVGPPGPAGPHADRLVAGPAHDRVAAAA
ncbi:unnamed protein product, partial [Heterosigma akashiwo]